MNVDCFLDTNVLVYAFSNLPADETKRARAEEVIRQNSYGISAQVLQELYVVLTTKAKIKMPPERALVVINSFEGTPCVITDAGLVWIAIKFSIRYQISYWDGAIIAAAARLGAATVYSEDLNDGQSYEGVTVVNPFKNC